MEGGWTSSWDTGFFTGDTYSFTWNSYFFRMSFEIGTARWGETPSGTSSTSEWSSRKTMEDSRKVSLRIGRWGREMTNILSPTKENWLTTTLVKDTSPNHSFLIQLLYLCRIPQSEDMWRPFCLQTIHFCQFLRKQATYSEKLTRSRCGTGSMSTTSSLSPSSLSSPRPGESTGLPRSLFRTDKWLCINYYLLLFILPTVLKGRATVFFSVKLWWFFPTFQDPCGWALEQPQRAGVGVESEASGKKHLRACGALPHRGDLVTCFLLCLLGILRSICPIVCSNGNKWNS